MSRGLITLCVLAVGAAPACREAPADPTPERRPRYGLRLDAEAEIAAAREALQAGKGDRAIGYAWPVVQEHPDDLEGEHLVL